MLLSSTATIGFQVLSAGTVTIDDPDTIWENNGRIIVGSDGEGRLNILNGGMLATDNTDIGRNFGSSGAVLISGPGSSCFSSGVLTVGSSGEGELLITEQAVLQNMTFGTTIGRSEDGSGCVTIDGPGSLWAARGIVVSLERDGFGPNAKLNILNGGSCTSSIVIIGDHIDAFGVVTVDGAESLLDVEGNILCGDNGLGILDVLNKGTVNCHDAFISRFDPGSSASARLTIDGQGSRFTASGMMSVGGDVSSGQMGGTAVVEICDDGQLVVAEEMVLFPSAVVEIKSGLLCTDPC